MKSNKTKPDYNKISLQASVKEFDRLRRINRPWYWHILRLLGLA